MLPKISSERLNIVVSYSWQDVNPQKFKNQESWPLLKDILLYHPNPIVRHEASYIIGDYNIHDLVPALIDAVKFDSSIVAKHEAAEALGFIKGKASLQAYNFLKDIINNKDNYDLLVRHDDVQVTAIEALKLLESEM